MAKIAITIIGLGRIGASIGLALKRYNARSDVQHQFEITAVEERAAVLKEAEGAFDKSARNLYDAVRDRDIVVIALPYADVRRTYQVMSDAARAGVVILDTSPLKTPSLKWAAEYLPKEAHMVGITPIVNPKYLFGEPEDTLHAHADYFDNGNMLLMPSATAIREAVELATDFSSLLGATVHFMDAAEHDGLVAATEGLPSLLGVATFSLLAHNPGWGDIQRLINPDFGRLTHHLFDTHPDDLRDTWLTNRASLVNYLDSLIESLSNFRQVIAANDRPAVEAALIEAADDYSAWINRRYNNKWDDENAASKSPSAGDMLMSGLMGGFLSKRLRGQKDDE
jgi:prephenate dehydrogenase